MTPEEKALEILKKLRDKSAKTYLEQGFLAAYAYGPEYLDDIDWYWLKVRSLVEGGLDLAMKDIEGQIDQANAREDREETFAAERGVL